MNTREEFLRSRWPHACRGHSYFATGNAVDSTWTNSGTHHRHSFRDPRINWIDPILSSPRIDPELKDEHYSRIIKRNFNNYKISLN